MFGIAEPGNRPTPEKRYVDKSNYGTVPKYLQTVKKEIQAEKNYIAAAMDQERQSQEMGQSKMRLLPENERLRVKLQLLNVRYVFRQIWSKAKSCLKLTLHFQNIFLCHHVLNSADSCKPEQTIFFSV